MRWERIRTELERIGNTVEHVRVHVRVDQPVAARIVTSGDEEGVPLSHRDGLK